MDNHSVILAVTGTLTKTVVAVTVYQWHYVRVLVHQNVFSLASCTM